MFHYYKCLFKCLKDLIVGHTKDTVDCKNAKMFIIVTIMCGIIYLISLVPAYIMYEFILKPIKIFQKEDEFLKFYTFYDVGFTLWIMMLIVILELKISLVETFYKIKTILKDLK